MAIFEHYSTEARQLEQEIVRKGVILGIDWDDEVAVRTLAREALAYRPGADDPAAPQPERRAKIELFALAQLMLKVMAESASEQQLHTHGGPVWKIFGKALWLESGLG